MHKYDHSQCVTALTFCGASAGLVGTMYDDLMARSNGPTRRGGWRIAPLYSETACESTPSYPLQNVQPYRRLGLVHPPPPFPVRYQPALRYRRRA